MTTMPMTKMLTTLSAALGLCLFLALSGCDGEPKKNGGEVDSGEGENHKHDDEGEDAHADHDHPDHGPHEGHLIELGDEEYHGEIVHDPDDNKVTIYILDSAGEDTVSIPEKSVTINLRVDGDPQQFKLASSPLRDDRAGRSSRFTAVDEELSTAIDNEDAGATLSVKIGGRTYKGKIEHHHEEDGHHDHEDEDR